MKKRILVFALAVPVVLFCALELGLRLTREHGDFPPADVRFSNDIPGIARTVAWKVDSSGLRKAGWEDGRPRVLCLGGHSSMPMLQSDDATWWGVAAAELEKSGKPAAFAATGVPGQPASLPLRWIHHYAPLLSPKVVVLAFGPDEVLARPAGYRFEPGSLSQPLTFRPEGWKGAVLNVSAIAREIRMMRLRERLEASNAPFLRDNGLRDRLESDRKAWAKAPPLEELPWVHDPADEIAATLREFKDLAARHRFIPVVLWEPWPHRPGMTPGQDPGLRQLSLVSYREGYADKTAAVRVDPAWIDHRLRAFRTRAAAVAEGLGMTFIDAATPLENSPDMFIDDTLWTDAGARAVAGIAAPVLAGCLNRP